MPNLRSPNLHPRFGRLEQLFGSIGSVLRAPPA